MRSVDVIRASAGVAAGHGGGCGRGRRTVGIDGELSDDEGCEEEQSWFDRAGVREGHLDRPAAPTLALDEDELAFALGERVTLVPAAGRAQRELAASPVKPPASAQVSRGRPSTVAVPSVAG